MTHPTSTQLLTKWLRPMSPRRRDEHHRVATPLELLFDLVFVVAIAAAGQQLHHGLAENHMMQVLPNYAMAFFAIWWAWMNFTWFASAYDNDDLLYRFYTFIQIIGSLIFAAGIPLIFQSNDFSVSVAGYVIMRLALVAQWIRAGLNDPLRRKTAFRYAIGITLVQTGWIAYMYFCPASIAFPVFWVLALGEISVPIWAERAEITPWHPHHIAERYSLLTIIILGEIILAAFNAFQTAITAHNLNTDLVVLMIGSMIIMFGMWWSYFEGNTAGLLTSQSKAFIWGYGHFFIFASLAAVGAGLAAAVDVVTHHAHISNITADYIVVIPIVIYTTVLWLFQDCSGSKNHAKRRWLYPLSAMVMLCLPLIGNVAYTVLAIGIFYMLRIALRRTEALGV